MDISRPWSLRRPTQRTRCRGRWQAVTPWWWHPIRPSDSAVESCRSGGIPAVSRGGAGRRRGLVVLHRAETPEVCSSVGREVASLSKPLGGRGLSPRRRPLAEWCFLGFQKPCRWSISDRHEFAPFGGRSATVWRITEAPSHTSPESITPQFLQLANAVTWRLPTSGPSQLQPPDTFELIS